MGRCARSMWTWMLAVSLAAQLTLALGHVHAPHSGSIAHNIADAHGGTPTGRDQALSETREAHAPVRANLTQEPVAQQASVPNEPIDRHVLEADDSDEHKHTGDQCDLCWILAAFGALLVQLLAGLPARRNSAKRLKPARYTPLARASAFEPYRARAPPTPIHA